MPGDSRSTFSLRHGALALLVLWPADRTVKRAGRPIRVRGDRARSGSWGGFGRSDGHVSGDQSVKGRSFSTASRNERNSSRPGIETGGKAYQETTVKVSLVVLERGDEVRDILELLWPRPPGETEAKYLSTKHSLTGTAFRPSTRTLWSSAASKELMGRALDHVDVQSHRVTERIPWKLTWVSLRFMQTSSRSFLPCGGLSSDHDVEVHCGARFLPVEVHCLGAHEHPIYACLFKSVEELQRFLIKIAACHFESCLERMTGLEGCKAHEKATRQ